MPMARADSGLHLVLCPECGVGADGANIFKVVNVPLSAHFHFRCGHTFTRVIKDTNNATAKED